MIDDNDKAEIVAVDPMVELGQMPLLTEEQIKNLERMVTQQKQIKQIVLKTTSVRHWLVMGDNAYLTEAGVKIIGSFFGLGIKNTIPEEKIEHDENGEYYSYSTICEITKNGRSVAELGYADSRDSFFSSAGKKPQSEISRGNIKKKSMTNAVSRAVKAFLGIDFTKAEVEKVVGSLGGASAVDYKGKAKEELTADDVALRKEAKEKITLICESNVEAAKVYIQKLTEWPEKDFKGHTEFDKISMKALKMKMKTINKHFEEWESKQKEGNQDGEN